ncbi:ExeA family protein [Uliginosibacterium gangwonense]|uniref:ExeA family protein n=1 Tax=Uliginosibacterium gangwonense TaxID=392736 RepID=UPI00036AFA43|nr:AAA family ATPase [Uliginosibacterium gangwonense]
MYKDHFGLHESPFRITPHTGRFFAGAKRGAVLEALCFAIAHDEGIIRVTGEVGTGKTMLCRMLLEQLPADIQTLYIANPSLSPQQLLETLADDLGLPQEADTALLRRIEKALIALHAQGKKVVAIIDEAHAMPRESLEQIRLLSNLETSTHKLLQIVLFGQPELNALLAEPTMRSLRERITQSFELEPMQQNELAAYLDFRLRAAGYKGPELFSKATLGPLMRASRGLTRRINILADKALLAAFADNTHTLSLKHIHAAMHDAQFAPLGQGMRRIGLAAGGITLAALLIGLGIWGQKPPTSRTEATSGATTGASLPTAVQSSPPAASSSPTASQPTPQLSPLAQTILEQTRTRLATTPGEHFFIELRSAPVANAQSLESLITAVHTRLRADRLQLYLSHNPATPRLHVLYGPFANEASAQKIRGYLPTWARSPEISIRRYTSLD